MLALSRFLESRMKESKKSKKIDRHQDHTSTNKRQDGKRSKRVFETNDGCKESSDVSTLKGGNAGGDAAAVVEQVGSSDGDRRKRSKRNRQRRKA
jgi:hypothetical protein